MKTIAAMAVAAGLMSFVASAGATSLPVAGVVQPGASGLPVVEVKVKGKNVAKGVAIGLGVLGVIGILSAAEKAKAEEREHMKRCRYWLNKCEDGKNWACDKYEYNCIE